MRVLVLLVGVAVLVGCGGDEGGVTPVFDGSSAQDTVGSDTAPGVDGAGGEDGVTAADSGAAADTGAAVDTTPDDIVTGDKAVGEGCAADSECQSGLCLSSSLGMACTATCASEADCDGYPIGMYCLPLRPGRSGCVPEGAAPPATCAGHADCAYPLYCRRDGVGCDLPECLHDGDCAADQECELATRRCQPKVCAGDLDCKHPALVCADDQSCAPPECERDTDCGAAPAYCHPVQRVCKEAPACQEVEEGQEGDGCAYNENCLDGSCYPDLCYQSCPSGRVCDPASGWCGAACSGQGQSTCADDEACLPSGVCKPNQAPIAWAFEVASGEGVALVSVGASVALSGEGSIDPEGGALVFRWSVLDMPAGSGVSVGDGIGGDSPTVSFTPDRAGRFVIGLTVTDVAGLDSIGAAVTLIAR